MSHRWIASIAPLALLAVAGCTSADPQIRGKSPDRITVAVQDEAALPEAAETAGSHCVDYDDIAVMERTEQVGDVILAHFECR